MSKHEMDDLRTPGSSLSEDSQPRLARLRDHMKFLSRLAQAPTADGEQDWPPQLRMQELAACLGSLAEQADLVLAETSWPAAGQARADGCDATSGSSADGDATPDSADEGDVQPDAADERAAGPGEARDASGTAGGHLVFGLTIAQADALDNLVRTLSAYGSALALDDMAELGDDTVPTLGQAVHETAAVVREILDQLVEQRLDRQPRPRNGVAEERDAYAVESMSMAPDNRSALVLPRCAHRLPEHVSRPGGVRLH